MRAKMDDDDATDRDRATGRAKRRQRARDAVDDEDEAAMREAFLDGAELFALGTAVAVKARAAPSASDGRGARGRVPGARPAESGDERVGRFTAVCGGDIGSGVAADRSV